MEKDSVGPTFSVGSIEASIFYVPGKRVGGEPDAIRQRGSVLYGEALLRPRDIPRCANIYSEGSKLHRLEWRGPAEAFTSLLQEPFWDHPKGKLRFTLGLIRRPALISLPGASIAGIGPEGGTLPPAATGSPIDAFVCIDKESVAKAVVAGCGGDKATVAALERLKFLTRRDLRGRDVARLVVDPLEDSDDAWIDAACDVGVMLRHPSGVTWQLTGPHEERLRARLREVLVRGPAQLGLVLQMMGEVDARGVRFEPIDIVSLVEERFGTEVSVRAVSDHLRATFARPDSIRDRSFVTECFRPSFSRKLVEAAFYAWNSRLPQLASFPRLWGREFAFMFLGRLAPEAAVQLVEDLQDITIVVVTAGLFRDHLGDIGQIARALVSAKSAFLRAFGVQAMSVSWHRAYGASHVVAPDDVRKTVAELRSMGLPPTERLAYLVLWSRDPDEERQGAIVDELLVELRDPAIAEPEQQATLRTCLDQAAHVVPRLFDRLGELPADAASKMCRSLLAALPDWLPVSESDGKKRTFYRRYLPICRAFATAAGWLADKAGQAPVQLLRNAMSFDAIKELTRPVSPLVPRPGRLCAVNALGWTVLCSMLTTNVSGHAPDAYREARDLVNTFSGDLDDDLGAVLAEMLAAAPAGVEPSGQ